MQGYSEGFAAIYNMRWNAFASAAAPRIIALYEQTPLSHKVNRLLDLACGTGLLMLAFLERGYEAVGLDLSPAMLAHAQDNVRAQGKRDFLAEGKVRFVKGDAADFTLDETFGLVTSTFDALNHLPDMDALQGCFRSVFRVLEPGGLFVFDLNTRFGLQRWAGMNVQDEDDLVLITRGVVVDEENRAYTQISGFLRQENGLYKRFNQVAYNTIFAMDEVSTALADAGFTHTYFAQPQALDVPVENPETYSRVFVIAKK
ncbi:MAG: class I SAM-dependent methyltransferase [Anaerolineae bacterium]|jgi:SAM-dependent methyltransferase|nr:class I SAM-dependent methyltransferase [Anaerolineae bacterium]